MIVCEICGRGPAPEHGGVSVIRQNPLGEHGIWRCLPHNDLEISPEVQNIMDALEDDPDIDEDL